MPQNIDPVYLLEPIITILFSVGLVVYWHYRRSFRRALLGYSLIAYAGAIAVKVALQALTFSAFQARFGNNPLGLGVYFGAQTVFFEVGGAFLVAAWAVSQGKLDAKDEESYGLGLALWENAGYVGVLGLINFTVVYVTLASGGPTSEQLFSSLMGTRPELFYAPLEALSRWLRSPGTSEFSPVPLLLGIPLSPSSMPSQEKLFLAGSADGVGRPLRAIRKHSDDSSVRMGHIHTWVRRPRSYFACAKDFATSRCVTGTKSESDFDLFQKQCLIIPQANRPCFDANIAESRIDDLLWRAS